MLKSKGKWKRYSGGVWVLFVKVSASSRYVDVVKGC